MDDDYVSRIMETREWVDRSRHHFTRRVGDYVLQVIREAPDPEWLWHAGRFDPTRREGLGGLQLGGRADSAEQAMGNAMTWLESHLATGLDFVRKELGL